MVAFSKRRILAKVHYMTNISFYHIFCISLNGNEIIIIPQGKFLAPKWCHSINNAKIVLETKHYLHKINKTPFKIHKYINKTCLKQNQTKLKKKTSDLYTIYNTNCKKNTTIREDFTTFQSIITKFRNG